MITEIKYRPLASLKKHPGNPRTIKDASFKKLVQSIDENPDYFEARPIILSDRTGELIIIAGNQRYAAAKEIGIKDVPTVVLPALTEEKEREIMIRDNISNGDWDFDLLAKDWDAELLNEWGLEVPLWSDANGIEGNTDPDAVPEPEPEPVAQLGDLWLLGEHRLLCGDSADEKPPDNSGLFFDPPWDIDYKKIDSNSVLAFTDCQRAADIINMYGAPTWIFVWDCVSSWYTPNRPLKRSKLCLWYGDISNFNFNGAHYGDAGEQREVFNTRGSYVFTPDPRGKHLSDVFQMPITQLHAAEGHSHAKPIDWVRMLIGDCISELNIYDPYAGSGAALIACEQLQKKCFSVEINPLYCDIIIKRWQDFTGKQATLEATGETWEQIKEQRLKAVK